MNKKGIIMILLLTTVVLVSMSSCTAFFGLFESPTVINVNGTNLVLPNNYTYIDGNGTDVVQVKNSYEQIFAITTDDVQTYYGTTEGFQQIDTGYNVTGFQNYDSAADMSYACLLNVNGTRVIVDFVSNNGSTGPTSMVADFANDLQIANGLTQADWSLLGVGGSGTIVAATGTTSSGSSSGGSVSSSDSKAPSDEGASDNDGDGVLEDQYGNLVNENMGAHDDSDSGSSSSGSSSNGGSSSGGSSSVGSSSGGSSAG